MTVSVKTMLQGPIDGKSITAANSDSESADNAIIGGYACNVLWCTGAGNAACVMNDRARTIVVFGVVVGRNDLPYFTNVNGTSTTAAGIVVGIHI